MSAPRHSLLLSSASEARSGATLVCPRFFLCEGSGQRLQEPLLYLYNTTGANRECDGRNGWEWLLDMMRGKMRKQQMKSSSRRRRRTKAVAVTVAELN